MSGSVCLNVLPVIGNGGYRVSPAVFAFRIFVDDLKFLSGENKADRCVSLTVKLFSRKLGSEDKIASFSPDTEDLSDHGHHKPACGSCQIMIHSSTVRAEIFRNSRIDTAGIKIQRSFGQCFQRFPTFFRETASVQGVGIHYGHM